jgi:hypothetical protein
MKILPQICTRYSRLIGAWRTFRGDRINVVIKYLHGTDVKESHPPPFAFTAVFLQSCGPFNLQISMQTSSKVIFFKKNFCSEEKRLKIVLGGVKTKRI